MALKNNTWKLNQWYDQSVAGNVSYTGSKELWAWGWNNRGNLGQNSRAGYSSPVQIPGTNWAQLTGRGDPSGTLATKTDGTLWSWGYNIGGNLGHNNRTHYSSPTQVGSDTNWGTTSKYQLTGMYYANFAIKDDGTLWSMGYNNSGSLGLNNNTPYSSPTQIGSDSTWRTVEAGMIGYMAAGTKTDGTGWTWGANQYGTLGQNAGAPAKKSSPTQLPGTTWSRISPGDQWYSVLGSKTDGTLWAWGYNGDGQLGLNQNGNYFSSPVQIPGTTWTDEFVGANKNWLAVKSDNTLWTWGENTNGSLGQNQAYPGLSAVSSPIQIPGTTWSQVGKLGHGSCMALKTDGTLWAWGTNGAEMGQLGQNQGGNAYYSSPTQIPGTSWYRIFGSTPNHAYAIRNA